MSSQKLETIKEQVEQNTADYSQMIQLGKLFQPAFNVVWNAIAPYVIGRDSRGDTPASLYDELFLQGGRASGKSYFASVIVWLALESDPKKNGVIIRKVGSSIRKSCWKQMMKVRKRLELYHWKPKRRNLPLQTNLLVSRFSLSDWMMKRRCVQSLLKVVIFQLRGSRKPSNSLRWKR